jgi:ATP-dependent Clp protease ATP-binding subunit ClpA
MFERFTDRARNVVVLAQEEARLLDHNYIGTEHILLGLLREGGGVAARVTTSAGLSLEAARTEVERIIGRGKSTPSGHIPFTPRAKKILELSLREALEQQKSYIGTEHILLGMVREGQGVGAQILEEFVGPASAFRQRVIAAANEPGPDDAADDVPDVDDPEPGPAPETVTGRPPGWPPPVEAWRSVRVQATAVRDLRDTLRSIERRLAAIERHLGIAAEPPEAGPEGPAGAGAVAGEAAEPSEPMGSEAPPEAPPEEPAAGQ